MAAGTVKLSVDNASLQGWGNTMSLAGFAVASA